MTDWMRECNDSFERRLKTELPLDLQLLEGIDEPPVDAEALEKAAKAQETPNAWPVSARFDIAKGERSESPELTYADLSRQRDPLTEMVTRAVREELRRHAASDEPNEVDNGEDEPEEMPADEQVKADMNFLKAEQRRGVDLWEMTNAMLGTDRPRAVQLRKAIAYMGVV